MNTKNVLGIIQKGLVIAPERRNVGSTDRIISAAAGAYLGYLAFRNFKKNYTYLLPASYLLWRSASGYCAIYDLTGTDTTEGASPIVFTKAVTIQANKDDVYQYWRQLENLPAIMTHVSEVQKISDTKYLWKAEFNKQQFSWNAEIIEDIPGERISWMSVDSPDVENGGTVEFTDIADGGTELKVHILYKPAKTQLGRLVAKVLNPLFKQKVQDDLMEFKRRVELGEFIFNRSYV
jgi:uncharacterized membrane protein